MDPFCALQSAPGYSHAGGLRALAAKTSPFIIKIRSARQPSASLCSERKQNCSRLRPSRLGENGPDVCAGSVGSGSSWGSLQEKLSIGQGRGMAGRARPAPRPSRAAPRGASPGGAAGGAGTARRAPRRGDAPRRAALPPWCFQRGGGGSGESSGKLQGSSSRKGKILLKGFRKPCCWFAACFLSGKTSERGCPEPPGLWFPGRLLSEPQVLAGKPVGSQKRGDTATSAAFCRESTAFSSCSSPQSCLSAEPLPKAVLYLLPSVSALQPGPGISRQRQCSRWLICLGLFALRSSQCPFISLSALSSSIGLKS